LAYERFMRTLARVLQQTKGKRTPSALELYSIDYAKLLRQGARGGLRGDFNKLDVIVELTEELGRQLKKPVWVCFRPLAEQGYFIMWPWDAYAAAKPGQSPAEALILVLELTKDALIERALPAQLLVADLQDIKRARRAYALGGVQVDEVRVLKETTYWNATVYSMRLDTRKAVVQRRDVEPPPTEQRRAASSPHHWPPLPDTTAPRRPPSPSKGTHRRWSFHGPTFPRHAVPWRRLKDVHDHIPHVHFGALT
jgi:hypothetical protein